MFEHHFVHDQYVLDMKRRDAEIERRRVILERLAPQEPPVLRRSLFARLFGRGAAVSAPLPEPCGMALQPAVR